MKKFAIAVAAALALSLAACGSTDPNGDSEVRTETSEAVTSQDTVSADEESEDDASSEDDTSSEDIADGEEIPPLYSETGDESEIDSCKIRVGYQHIYTIDDKEHIAKIVDWLKRASDDPGTMGVAENVDRSGSILDLRINGGKYNIEYFEDEEQLTETYTDDSGVVHYPYNVQANGHYYLVPNELCGEFEDIISEALGHDVGEDYVYDPSEEIVAFEEDE